MNRCLVCEALVVAGVGVCKSCLVRAHRVEYDRKVLVDVLVYHYRADFKGCGCGWAELGRSWPEHVATVYEESVAARADDRSPGR